MDDLREPPPPAARTPHELVERVIRRVTHSGSAAAVFGPPVERGGYTVVPVARVCFVHVGAVGPELAPRAFGPPADGRLSPALSSGGGAAGAGVALPAGHIEIGPEGSRFVPAGRDWRGLLVFTALAWSSAMLIGLLRIARRG